MTAFQTPIRFRDLPENCQAGNLLEGFPQSIEKRILQDLDRNRSRVRALQNELDTTTSFIDKTFNPQLDRANIAWTQELESTKKTLEERQRELANEQSIQEQVPGIQQALSTIALAIKQRVAQETSILTNSIQDFNEVASQFNDLVSREADLKSQSASLTSQKNALATSGDPNVLESSAGFVDVIFTRNKLLLENLINNKQLASKPLWDAEAQKLIASLIDDNTTSVDFISANISDQEVDILTQVLESYKPQTSADFNIDAELWGISKQLQSIDTQKQQLKASIFRELLLLFPSTATLSVDLEEILVRSQFNRTGFNPTQEFASLKSAILGDNNVSGNRFTNVLSFNSVSSTSSQRQIIETIINKDKPTSPLTYLNSLTLSDLYLLQGYLKQALTRITGETVSRINRLNREVAALEIQRRIAETKRNQADQDWLRIKEQKKQAVLLAGNKAARLIDIANVQFTETLASRVLNGLVEFDDLPANTQQTLTTIDSLQKAKSQAGITTASKNTPELGLVQGKAPHQMLLGIQNRITTNDLPLVGRPLTNLIGIGNQINEILAPQVSTRNIRRELIELEYDLDPFMQSGQLKNPNEISKVTAEFYVNPERIQYTKSKNIVQTFTQGGYVYTQWGDRPLTLDISGTTARAGEVGIRVLEHFYDVSGKSYEEMLTLYENPQETDPEFWDALLLVGSQAKSSAIGDALTANLGSYRDILTSQTARFPVQTSFKESLEAAKEAATGAQNNNLFATMGKLFNSGVRLVGSALNTVGQLGDIVNTVVDTGESVLTSALENTRVSIIQGGIDQTITSIPWHTKNCLVKNALIQNSRVKNRGNENSVGNPVAVADLILTTGASAISKVSRFVERTRQGVSERDRFRQQKILQDSDNKARTLVADFRDDFARIRFMQQDLKYGLRSTVRIRLYHEDNIYIGHLAEFNWTRVADKPLIQYNMKFTVEERIRFVVNAPPIAQSTSGDLPNLFPPGLAPIGQGILRDNQFEDFELSAAQSIIRAQDLARDISGDSGTFEVINRFTRDTDIQNTLSTLRPSNEVPGTVTPLSYDQKIGVVIDNVTSKITDAFFRNASR